MPRGSKYPSEIFKNILSDANADLVLAAKKAGDTFKHRGIVGDERAAALKQFFVDRLPAAFGVSKGEAIDFGDRRTGQLDLVIYEKADAAPIVAGGENLLLPCEALYAVIEVKSILNRVEVGKSLEAAKKVRALRPYKKEFIGARSDGEPADHDSYRCLYILFAFDTDIAVQDWLKKEYQRVEELSVEKGIPLDTIDRIIVLDRGMINPSAAVGKAQQDEDDAIFLDFFLHVVNFLRRESGRRPPADLQVYAKQTASGWIHIR